MATIESGTERRNARHSMAIAPIGFMVSMALPVAVIAAGIPAEGWGAISWVGAAVWGIVATIAFTVFSMMGKAMGMTEMDLLDLLGSAVVEPHTAKSRTIGAVVHLMNGAVLAVGWTYAARLAGVDLNWASGTVLGCSAVAAGAVDDDHGGCRAPRHSPGEAGRPRHGRHQLRPYDPGGQPHGPPRVGCVARPALLDLAARLTRLLPLGG